MNLLRKVFWPSAIALTFMVAMAAMGQGVRTVDAAPRVVDICGPSQIAVGVTAGYIILIEDYDGPVTIDLDDNEGDTDITSKSGPRGSSDPDDEEDEDDNVHQIIPNTDIVTFALPFETATGDADAMFDMALDEFGVSVATCFAGVVSASTLRADVTDWFAELIDAGEPIIAPAVDGGFDDQDIDCPAAGCGAAPIAAAVNAVVAAMQAGIFECDELGDRAENAALIAGAGEPIGAQINDAVGGDACEDPDEGEDDIPFRFDSAVFVDVTCQEPGEFDLSVSLTGIPLAATHGQIEVLCKGEVEAGTITALPTSVEITPSISNVAHSLVWVQLTDIEGGPVPSGIEVLFTSDRCSIESSAVDTEAEYEAAQAVFGGSTGLNVFNPATAAAVESSVFATTAPDSASRQQEETNVFWVFSGPDNIETARAAVILHCDPIHAPGVTPGPAVVTAIVERGSVDDGIFGNNDDLVLRTTVTVVGPPAANGVTLTAAPATLACGEKATLTVTVKDAIGQNVSDNTWVEAVTNAGGVLAGTGAVAGQAGLVSPVSSTVMGTYGGQATFYLLTSTAHVGAYEVVVTTGGGGGVTGQLVNGGVTTNLLGGLFTTQPISVQVTVTCTVPAAAVSVPVPVPTTIGPRTGQGITPPSTGDAGLASTESNWVVGAVAAVVASLVVAGFAVKLARDEN